MIPSTESSVKPCSKIFTLIILIVSCGCTQSKREGIIANIYKLKVDSCTLAASKRRFLLQKFHTIAPQFNGVGFFFITNATLIGVSR